MATKFEKKQSKRGFLRVASLLFLTALTVSVQAQQINGAVFGGGRMADVDGNTAVSVVNCDTISAVYGGNDIAGTVSGNGGSTVTLGTAATTTVNIGSVYGGGNGFYKYDGQLPSPSVTSSAFTTSCTEVGSDDVILASGTIPSIKKTAILVNDEDVRVDSLFGGAKNAFITMADALNTSITINYGVIYAVFGGNNYGGTLANGSTQSISVTGTKIGSTSVNLGGTKSLGRAWTSDNSENGIRYLFGGGNKVAGKNVVINITGGQIDTLFGGGNSADVTSTSVTVNVTSPLYDTYTESYSPTASIFDIRCLFGGNNAANMTSGVPTLNLTKGGIHNVYGGGNKGEMCAAQSYEDNHYKESYVTDNATYNNAGAKRSTNVTVTSDYIVIDTLYGGGQSAGTWNDTYVEIAGGHIGVVYGGTNISGRIGKVTDGVVARERAKTNVWIHGGTIHNTVFGASNGYYRCINGSSYVNSATNILFPEPDPYPVEWFTWGLSTPEVYKSYVLITGGTVLGNVYSSGNMAAVGKIDALSSDPELGGIALLHITGGTVNNVFGGGNMGSVYGGNDLRIGGSAHITGDVYGGNDKTGRVFSVLRNTSGVTEIANASTAAGADITTTVYNSAALNISSGSSITLSDQNASTYTRIYGTPTIDGSVYGGGNGDYIYQSTYSDKASYLASNPGVDPDKVVVNGCSSVNADQRSSFVDINVADGGYVNRVFGGGNSMTSGRAARAVGAGYDNGNVMVYLNSASSPADNETNIHVGTIFGANNHVAMSRVPRVLLVKGKVGDVYGGGNMGDMTGNDEPIDGLAPSTYVQLNSDLVVVTHNIYGGCNVADVLGDSYVKIQKGIVRGDIFGGNDLAGEVEVSHVLIDGNDLANLHIRGNVYGGGNGDYPFYVQEVDGEGVYYTKSDLSKVYAKNDPAAGVGATSAMPGKYCYSHFTFFDMDGRPYVDSSNVLLNGKFLIDGNVYGGGISGDCRMTNVLVDAENGDFNGMIFGAGRGRVNNMGLRIGTCHDSYIGVAQDANNDGVTDRDGSGNIIYGTGCTMGNVLDTAFLTVLQFKSMGVNGGRSAMFGGGQSGNVRTTMVRYENTATSHLNALYLGCLASDVTGTATGIINANESNTSSAIIDTLYGGNDFTGRVAHTDMTVNSGVFFHMFGAGNGDYDYGTWITNRIGDAEHQGLLYENRTAVTTPGCADTVPYTMIVDIHVNGGVFLNTVYGGGNMGLVGNRDMVAGNMSESTPARVDDIGRITFNIHGGDFRRHVFTGARGKTDMTSKFFALTGNNASGQPLGKQLAYAQKILNMDSGHVAFSVYGGSEAVDDGYPYECRDKVPGTSTTLRPSSVLNITGGHIEKSVYGGGYQGNIYGSVYVNIGIDAVRDSKVWDYTDGTFAMAAYKPNLADHSGYDMENTYNSTTQKVDKVYVPVSSSNIPGNPTLKKNVVDLSASVYNASDWGEAGSNAYFSTRGVFGGVTNILIDGKGYYTSLTNPFTVDLPSMSIANSIIGAGTSTEGGDVNRLITMRHFGDYSCPEPSKTLFSIQRADKVVLDSVFIVLQGEQDAFSAYASPNYSLCRIDTLIFRVDNIVMVEAPAIYLGYVVSMKTDEVYKINKQGEIYDTVRVVQPVVDDVVSTVPNDFFDNLLPANHADCNNPTNPCQDLDICAKLPTQRGSNESVAASNVLMMRNGSYVKVSPFVDGNGDGVDDIGHQFGHVYGWMFLLAQDATLSYVYADTKTNSNNTTDGGFIAPCWCDNFSGDANINNEIDYVNVNVAGDDDYRSWKVGTNLGTRVRNITLVANATPDNRLNFNLPAGDYGLYVGSSNTPSGTENVNVPADAGYAYATTYLELPPADGGNFYIINSVLIDQDNGGQLTLIDQGYLADSNKFAQTTDGVLLTLSNIAADPDYTFGLTFTSGDNFNNESCWNTGAIGSVTAPGSTRNLTETGAADGEPYPCWYRSLISGNTHITNQGGYLSNAIISGAVGAIPTMNFTLTYNTNIHSTITRDVLFTMLEFDSQGNFVGPVEVTVTISTVIKEFDDLEAPVLAMFNEGLTNDYVRKVTIPASFQQRDIYIEGIEWIKDTVGNYSPSEVSVFEDSGKKKWFQMAEYTGTPVESNNIFSIIVTPTESTTENINNSLGWYHIAKPDGFDVYSVARDAYEHENGSGTFSTAENNHKRDSNFCSWDLDYNGVTDAEILPMDATEERGLWIGTLDGRSTASIDVTLKFNGMYYYRDQFNPPLAWVRLKCHYYNTKSDDHDVFYINVKLRTRLEGDTIYMAPGKTLTRIAKAPNGDTKSITMHAYGYGYNEYRNGGTYEDGTQNPPDLPANYTNLTIDRGSIKNNPNNYLQDFRQVMLIFDEGDVIDIMETIPITSGTEPISVMGDDYSTIQVIRYSGSHFKFPTLGCANRNPLIEVYGSGFLTMRNVWFNGSGCTRAKEGITTDQATGGELTTVGSYNYYQNHARVKELLYANAPIIYCHGNGNVAFTKRVIMSNNFNASWNSDTNDVPNNDFIGGGAIAVARESGEIGNKPTVTLGDLCNLYDNVVVDWDAVVASQPGGLAHTSDWLPRNYGGGVYVDNGQLVFGSGSKGAELHVERNYYIKNLSNNAAIRTKTAKFFADGTGETSDEMISKTFQVYYLDTLEYPNYFALSNVYLTRKAASNGGCSNLVRLDEQSDVVYFLSEMTNTSKIGISKWFPGYVYDNTRSGIHLLENDAPRDTIAIARIGKGKSNTSMVDNNYSAKIFFNDSAYYSIDNRPNIDPENPTVVHPAAVPSFTADYPSVAYTQNTTDYPGYNDNIFIFRHTSLDQYNIYFQRCASFGKGIHQELDESACFAGLGRQFNLYAKGDSVSYHWNPTATCAMATDTLRFHVGGGFFPYTYKWEDITDGSNPQQLHSRRTVGSNAISLIGNPSYDALRVKAEYDTLVMRLEVASSALHPEYVYKVTASDLTGNCAVSQDVKVKIAKIVDESALRATKKYVDNDNFLLHRQLGTSGTESDEAFFWMPYPGVDSSSFHDRASSVYAETKELRAGWKHATGAEQTALHGLPYAGNGSDDVGDMTPRYMRLFVSYKVKPSIYPPLARGSVDVLSADGSSTIYTVSAANMADPEYSPSIELCPGEILQLRPTAASSSPAWEFMAWNYDPTSPSTATFVVSDSSRINNPVAYYSPGDYWWQAVTSFDINDHSPSGDASKATRYDYDLDYYGNVRIRTNKGLAWLISTVNGYNNQNAQTFHFDTIFLDFDANMVDMSAHKWSPLGTENNPFEGVFVGTDDNQHIANIIVNEDTVPLVGLFGYTNGAELNQFILDSAIMKGKNYVGSIVAQAENNTLMKDVTIERSVLFGQYFMGGMAASMKKSVMDNCKIYKYAEDNGVPFNDGRVRMFGEAIYAGGLVGYATGDTIRNCAANTDDFIERTHLSPIYYGGLVGYNKAENIISKKGRRKVTTGKTVLNNNYVHIATGITYQRVGGLIGYAEDVDMNNNYVYGIADYDKINGMLGGLAGIVGENVTISNCYFVDGMANDIIGYNNWDCEPRKSTTFHGRGHRVLLTERVDGYNNMTRALNAWVRNNNSNDDLYNTWRSDLDGINSGYPIFGDPDMIPVNDTLQTIACNSYEFDGLTFDQSGTYIFHVVDSADYLDSTFTLILTISNGDTTTLFDTINFGDGYEGNGYSFSQEDIAAGIAGQGRRDIYTFIYVDSLYTQNGCDSLVYLTLYVVGNVDVPETPQQLTEVKVYPNPTRGMVNVEGEALMDVEVYDNVSRQVFSSKVDGNKFTFDLSNHPTGSYYIRVRTAHGTVVKKLIKK